MTSSLTRARQDDQLQRFLSYLEENALPSDATLLQRRAAEDAWGSTIALPEGWTVCDVDAGGVSCERLQGPQALSGRVLVYLHGGGFGAGSALSHRHFVARLARAAGCAALTVEYRLSPEATFPAAVDDGMAVYRWLLARGTLARSVAFAGDSAGGGLVLAMALACKIEGLPVPASIYVLSPWADLTLSGSSHAAKAASDPMVTTEGLSRMASAYLGGASSRDPLASPVFGDFSGMCPILIQVGSDEVLLSDSLSLAERAALAGGEVVLEVWAGMVHVWALFHEQLDDARCALLTAGQWIGRHFAADREE